MLRGCPWRRPELSAESVPGAATTVGAHKLQPCVLELCKFFSQCLCRPFSHKTRMKRSANSPCCLQTAPLQTAVWIVLLLSVASLISLSCCTSLGGHNKPRQCKAQTHTGRQKLQGEAFWSILNKNEWLTSFSSQQQMLKWSCLCSRSNEHCSENEKKSCWVCTLRRTGQCVIHAVWWKQRLSTCRGLDLKKKNLKIKVKQWCDRSVDLAEI